MYSWWSTFSIWFGGRHCEICCVQFVYIVFVDGGSKLIGEKLINNYCYQATPGELSLLDPVQVKKT